jgi:protein O-GlcNAc transferase
MLKSKYEHYKITDMDPQLQLMLQQAIQAFQSGNLDGASLILTRVLRIDSKNLPALHILGLIKVSQANYKESVNFLRRAAQISPDDASIQYNLAKALADSGNDKDAVAHHKKAVVLAPNNPDVWLSYGKTASNLGHYDDALVWYNKALSLKPDYAEAALNIGATLKELKRYEEAITFAEQALVMSPNLAEAWLNKGVALKELKYFDEAIAHYDKALSLNSDYYEAWTNKGSSLHELKNFDEAIAHYDKALSLNSDYYEAWTNKGVTLQILKRYEEAIAHYDKALSIKIDLVEAWTNKGVSLQMLKRYDEAIFHFDKVLSLDPDINWVHGDLLHTKMKICSWPGLTDSFGDLSRRVMVKEKVVNPFVLLGLSNDALLLKQSSEIYTQSNHPFNRTLGPILKPPENQKIRVGYFSADFHNHATGYLMAELFELHDRSRFELIGFSFGPIVEDKMRQRLEKSFDQFIEVGSKSDLEVAGLSRNLNINIAVDLKGFTQDARTGIFSYRAAPIQVNYLGYPGTMGADYIDYIIADKTLIRLILNHATQKR